MAFNFNEITFDLKDLILFIGVVLYAARFESSINSRFDSIEIKLNKIVGDFTIENYKTNARIDVLKQKETSHKIIDKPELVAIIDNRKNKLKICHQEI